MRQRSSSEAAPPTQQLAVRNRSNLRTVFIEALEKWTMGILLHGRRLWWKRVFLNHSPDYDKIRVGRLPTQQGWFGLYYCWQSPDTPKQEHSVIFLGSRAALLPAALIPGWQSLMVLYWPEESVGLGWANFLQQWARLLCICRKFAK